MDLEQKAIERLRTDSEMSLSYYGEPLVITYSGGKDSDVQLELAIRSGIPFEVHNSHTTADAPQTVYHIRKKFKQLEQNGIKCKIEMPTYQGNPITMWTLIPLKLMPPTRMVRYCCQVLKETGCSNRMISTGVRWDESNARKDRESFEVITPRKIDKIKVSDETMLMEDNTEKRKLFERCELKAKTVVNPIIDWKHSDIWEFINQEHVETNPLYQCGYDRVGCIGCPVAGKARYKEFADFPTYKQAYIHAFDRMVNVRNQRNVKRNWKSGNEVFLWWMEDKNIEGQMTIDDFLI